MIICYVMKLKKRHMGLFLSRYGSRTNVCCCNQIVGGGGGLSGGSGCGSVRSGRSSSSDVVSGFCCAVRLLELGLTQICPVLFPLMSPLLLSSSTRSASKGGGVGGTARSAGCGWFSSGCALFTKSEKMAERKGALWLLLALLVLEALRAVGQSFVLRFSRET